MQIKKTLFLFLSLLIVSSLVYLSSISISTTAAEKVVKKSERQIIADETTELYKLGAKYEKAEKKDKSKLKDQLVKAAQNRKEKLKKLIRENPKEAVKVIINDKAKKVFPKEIQSSIEEEATIEGTYTAYQSDDFKNNHAEVLHVIKTDTETISLFSANDDKPVTGSGSKVKVQGSKLDNYMVIMGSENGTFTVLSHSLPPQVVGTGNKSVALIRFNFADDNSMPLDVTEAASMFNSALKPSVKSYFWQNSNYALEVSTTIYTTVYTLTTNKAGNCYIADWADEADDLASADGFDPDNFDYITYVFPYNSTCTFGGVGQVGGKRSWINMTNGLEAQTTHVVLHELGHNFGATHASTYRCVDGSSNPVTISNNCSIQTYGDYWDVMGSGSMELQAYNKVKLGLINAAKVRIPDEEGVFAIYPQQYATSAAALLMIPRDEDTAYYLEYRKPQGDYENIANISLFGQDQNWNEVFIRVGPAELEETIGDYFYENTYLLTNDPKPSFFSHSFLTPQRILEDNDNGIFISLESATAGAALVKLDYNTAPCVRNYPTITFNGFGQSGRPNETVEYTATVKNNDNSVCGPSTFTITPTFPSGSWHQPSTTITLNPKESDAVSIFITPGLDADPDFETYLFTETVTHPANGALTASDEISHVTFGLPLPTVTSATVVTSANPWTAWTVELEGTGFSFSSKAKIYDGTVAGGTVWADNVNVSVSGDHEELIFALPAKRPPSNCNLSSTCNIQFTLLLPSINVGISDAYTVPVTITLPQNSQADITAPSVAITFPSNGYTVPGSGGFNLQGTASDASGIDEIKLYLDGNLVKTCSSSPCAQYIAVSSLSVGPHTAYATATDNASPNQNGSTSTTINMTKN